MTEIAKLQKKLQEAGDATLPLSKGKGQTAACTFVLLGDKAEGWKNDSLTALLLLAGTGRFRAGQQKWQVKPGDWFLLAAGQDCKASLKEGLLVQLVLPEAFSVKDLKKDLMLGEAEEVGTHGRVAVDGPAGAAFLAALNEYQTSDSVLSSVLLKSQLLTALALALRALNEVGSLSEREIRRYISENYVSTSVKDAAAYYQLSPNYFSDLVKKKTGQSFIELVDEQKMEAAVRLLARPDLSIKQIIGLVGYRGKSFFYEKFGKYYGMSPAAKRKELFRQQGINL